MDSEYIKRKIVGEAAQEQSDALVAKSKLVKDQKLQKFSWEDLHVEAPIGYGGFSQVFKVQLWNQPGQYFALKCLNPNTKVKTKSFITGAVDLSIEGEILARLNHENIIHLHGTYGDGPLKSYVDADKGYFLVLDLLEDTLQNRLDKHRMSHRQQKSSSSRLRSSNSKSLTSISAVMERVATIAIGVAKGMEYLHSQGVALRDLKPDNVGFDAKGNIKLFDLGFAREVHTIKSTEVAGSLRYMAPEVALARGSKLSSDVYSFGILLWELCTLDKPYKQLSSRDEFMQTVIIDNWRHSTSGIPNNPIRKLIKKCWSRDSEPRPTFSKIVSTLRVELSLVEVVPGPSTKSFFGSSSSLRRINTWTSRKLSSSSFSLLRSMSRSGLFEKTDDTVTTEADESPISQQRNATFNNNKKIKNSTAKNTNATFDLPGNTNQIKKPVMNPFTDPKNSMPSSKKTAMAEPASKTATIGVLSPEKKVSFQDLRSTAKAAAAYAESKIHTKNATYDSLLNKKKKNNSKMNATFDLSSPGNNGSKKKMELEAKKAMFGLSLNSKRNSTFEVATANPLFEIPQPTKFAHLFESCPNFLEEGEVH